MCELTYLGEQKDIKQRHLFAGDLLVKYWLVNGESNEVQAKQVFWKYFTFTDIDMVAIVGCDFRDTLNTQIKNVVSLEILNDSSSD